MLTAFQPPRKRLPSGRKRVRRGVSSYLRPTLPLSACRERVWQKAAPFSCRENAASSDRKLLCCLQQLTVIVSCALSSICRSFPPFRESFQQSFSNRITMPCGSIIRLAVISAACRPCPVLLQKLQTSDDFTFTTDFSVILICHGQMHIGQHKGIPVEY